MSTTIVKPVRKFPPPCWTRDEALVLIDAYCERWHALHRAFLKNPDWDAVAEKVITSCPDVTPPKTSAQCRHKMEKLRQRHRAEKLRASSFPGGRFFSSWFYYEAMETIENNNNNNNKIKDPNDSDIVNGIPIADHRFKPSSVQNLVTLAASSTNHAPDFNSRVSKHNWGNQEDDNEHGYLVDSIINKNNHKNYPYTGGILIKPSIPSHVNNDPRKYSKVVRDHDHQVDENGEMWVKVSRNTVSQGKNQNENENNCKADLKQGKKRGNGVVHEVVSSIKLLGDGFMKMEKMKIDMVREIERTRVETEMKRNQLILESQMQIVDAFVKGLIENRK